MNGNTFDFIIYFALLLERSACFQAFWGNLVTNST